jgi:hypothetical protein
VTILCSPSMGKDVTMSTESPEEPLSFSTGPASAPLPATKFQVNRVALALSALGLALIIVSTFLPYTRIIVNVGAVSLGVTRTAWQMGAHKSIEIYAGPAIVFWALVAAVQEFIYYRPRVSATGLKRSFLMSGVRAQIINAAIITVICFQSWPGSWSTSPPTIVERGLGGYLTITGVALLAISVNFHYHDIPPASKTST